jgi:mannose-6-phosphate isomerase
MRNLDRFYILKNPVQKYAWGSHTAIAELIGARPDPNVPQAELWMGAHPKAPSMAKVNDAWVSLEEIIAAHPVQILGKTVADKFQNTLPYLFKVLAAARPLSLQAHPSLAQAREGYRKENDVGLALDAPNRNYKDENHKPECICAMTPFWALNGFRKITEILALAKRPGTRGLNEPLGLLQKDPNPRGLKSFFYSLMTLSPELKKKTADEVASKAELLAAQQPVFRWILRLAREYPGDIGILSPLFLNLIQLQPGQAMFLPSGELHAYLEGVGIELMANSDNVLRGGLTPKHIDVQELLKVLNFKERQVQILEPDFSENHEHFYAGDAQEFVLSSISVGSSGVYESAANRSAEILLCTSGAADITASGHHESIPLKKGTSIIVPAAVQKYVIEGNAVLFKAGVPV